VPKAPAASKARSTPKAPSTPKAAATSSDTFQGFADAGMKFFHSLAKHQDRDWFARHKPSYDEGWAAPMAALLAEARAAIDGAYPDCDLAEPKVFRIYRDVRFGADKSPFKTNVSGVIAARTTGKATDVPAAVYVQLGTETFAGAGLYMMDSRALARYRAAVQDDESGAELVKIVKAIEKKGFTTSAAEELKSAPRGIDPEHPRIGLLKKKGLIASFPAIPAGLIKSRQFVDWVIAQSRLAAPLVRWLVYNTA